MEIKVGNLELKPVTNLFKETTILEDGIAIEKDNLVIAFIQPNGDVKTVGDRPFIEDVDMEDFKKICKIGISIIENMKV